MQKNIYIILLIFLGVSGSDHQSARAQMVENPQNWLAKGDSLFNAKKYTEAVNHYQKVLAADQYSPQMLLKMAFVKEGLGDFTLSLYFLNVYYHLTADVDVLQKMASIAEEKKLDGYAFSDMEYFLAKLKKNKSYILLGVCVLCLLAFLVLVRDWRRRESITTQSVLLSFLILVFLAFFNLSATLQLLGLDYGTSQGIIFQPQTYLMEAPSAGAAKILVFDKGHRVGIIGKTDIWYKVRLDEQVGYIRESNLLRVD